MLPNKLKGFSIRMKYGRLNLKDKIKSKVKKVIGEVYKKVAEPKKLKVNKRK